MSIKGRRDRIGMRRIGRVVGLILKRLCAEAQAGVALRELDELCDALLREHGARPTPAHEYGFPGAACFSLNDEAVHGLPRDRKLVSGDVLKIDLTADLDGYVADAARTVVIGDHALGERLGRCARAAFDAALDSVKVGAACNAIGGVIESSVNRRGFSSVRALSGHGTGRKTHEPPTVPNYADPRCRQRLTDGLVITVEPVIAAGRGDVTTADDGWAIRTLDGSLTAHFEQTMIVTRGRPEVVTAA